LGLQDLLQTLCGQRVGVGIDQQIAALRCGDHASSSFSSDKKNVMAAVML
jgi:hypothetical protein